MLIGGQDVIRRSEPGALANPLPPVFFCQHDEKRPDLMRYGARFKDIALQAQPCGTLAGRQCGVFQGLMTVKPAASNGPVSRVATIKPCVVAVAAM